MGSRLRDHTRIFDCGVRARSNSRSRRNLANCAIYQNPASCATLPARLGNQGFLIKLDSSPTWANVPAAEVGPGPEDASNSLVGPESARWKVELSGASSQ